jgi:glutamate synthase domain-containing protein 2
MVYQRAKKVNDTEPFGSQFDVYPSGYEWMDHGLYAVKSSELEQDPRVMVGEGRCSQPYSSSVFNVSAMSFGSLSKNAVRALNYGAKKGGFAHNTGEGSISPYHLENGGDIIWQVGTGYFGCRADDGGFSKEKFIANATRPEVKMIEIKLSQGAKPGQGGILPAAKNTLEIATIRGVEAFTDVHSPPGHSAFSNPTEMVQFITNVRDWSGGKPVGFKLCIGREDEFEAIYQAIVDTGMTPDFISVDSGEGGTGAARVEFSNHLGAPLRDGLVFVDDMLKKFGIRDQIKLNATGKILSGFHIARALALGADITSSARAMMMAVGCIQALQCNRNTCPTGVATQDPALMRGLDPVNKGERVFNYHEETVHSLIELLAAAGLKHPNELDRKHIKRRVGINSVKTFTELHGQ